jgi:hypothetical protein
LLSKRGPLPLVRVQPIHFQGTIEDTWKPVSEALQRLQQGQPLLLAPEIPVISQAALHA